MKRFLLLLFALITSLEPVNPERFSMITPPFDGPQSRSVLFRLAKIAGEITPIFRSTSQQLTEVAFSGDFWLLAVLIYRVAIECCCGGIYSTLI